MSKLGKRPCDLHGEKLRKTSLKIDAVRAVDFRSVVPIATLSPLRRRKGLGKGRIVDKGITVADLFCGAGGMSLGFREAGLSVVRAIDHFAAAVETYRHNLGDHVVDAEIF